MKILHMCSVKGLMEKAVLIRKRKKAKELHERDHSR